METIQKVIFGCLLQVGTWGKFYNNKIVLDYMPEIMKELCINMKKENKEKIIDEQQKLFQAKKLDMHYEEFIKENKYCWTVDGNA